MVGKGAFEEGTLSTALEVYRSSEYQVTIVQQRAPLMKGTTSSYIEELTAWIKEASSADKYFTFPCAKHLPHVFSLQAGFKETVILSSADGTFRNDQQIAGHS